MEVEPITYSNYFGKINKCKWYRVTDNFNNYEVDVYIHTNRTIPSQARIENRANTNGFEWNESVPANVTESILYRQVTITHVPQLKAREYVIINQYT
jgi:hypothetical protein